MSNRFFSPKLTFFLKVSVSITVLCYLLQNISLHEISRSIRSMNVVYGPAILILVIAGMFLQSERWKRLILLPEIAKPSSYAFFRYTTIGFFFNLFLPTGFGGDAIRSISLGKDFQMIGKSIASTIVARILGLQALVLFMLIGSHFLNIGIPKHIAWIMQISGLIFLSASGFLWILVFFSNKIHSNLTERICKRIPLIFSLLEYRAYPKLFLFAFLDSIFLQVIILATNWMMFLALNIPMPIKYIIAIFPMVTLATMVPISFFGIGLREWAALSLYTYIPGVTNNGIMATLMLGYAYMLLQAFVGMTFWLFNRTTPSQSGVSKTRSN